MTYEHIDRDALIALIKELDIKELEAWLEVVATCPRCGRKKICTDRCTFYIYRPNEAKRIEKIRHLLYGENK